MKVPSIDIAKKWQEIFKKDLPDIIRRTEEIQKLRNEDEGFIGSMTAEKEIEECYYCYIYGNFLASSVMLCIALETIFKKLIRTRDSIRNIADKLLELEVITDSEFTMINDLINFRNKIVHARIPKKSVSEVAEVAESDYTSLWQECSKYLQLSNLFYRIQKNPIYYKELVDRKRNSKNG